MAGPDSGCDSSCFISATSERSLRGHDIKKLPLDIFSGILLVDYDVELPFELVKEGRQVAQERFGPRQCAHVLPTVPLTRASFHDVIYLKAVCFILF